MVASLESRIKGLEAKLAAVDNAAKSTTAKSEAKKPVEDDDSDVDLFGSDDEEEVRLLFLT